VVVFGCGGDRDRGKRPLMGAAAAQLADVTWLTSDNPRSEDPATIIEAIRQGWKGAAGGRELHVEVDRRRAIAAAVAAAAADDVVLIAGKGHEDYQEAAGARTSFSDSDEARRALETWKR
jgi:UDP-N-acetylmuramoyl-L-alanyl-D-glutamate--2,6-diaminopimelate ligase